MESREEALVGMAEQVTSKGNSAASKEAALGTGLQELWSGCMIINSTVEIIKVYDTTLQFPILVFPSSSILFTVMVSIGIGIGIAPAA